jgi:hypothetical protein
LKIHPNEQSLEEFLLSLDDGQRAVVRHLGWCGTCRSRTVYLPRPHTALVSLELAHLYAEQGRTEDLKRISAEMLPIFASRNIHREALAALAFFQKAVDTEKATAELVANVAAYLRRAEADPELRFEASKGDLP